MGSVLLAGFCLTQIAWAGSPTTVDVRRHGAILETRIVGSLAASGIDTTWVDMKDAKWAGATAGVQEGLDVTIVQIDSDVDSVLVNALAYAHIDADDGGTTAVASQQINAQGHLFTRATDSFARYWRVIITNDSPDSTDSYELRIQVPCSR